MTVRPAVLAGDSIDCRLGGREILRAAYVDAVPGSITALVGRSGAGKTTLFNVLVGRRRPDRGQVRWDGARVPRPSLAGLARRGLFYHPDRPWLALHLSPADHFAMLPAGREWRAVAATLGITGWLERRVGSLSGGELRLTELAVGVALQPAAALLDEPFRGLEPRYRERVAEVLRLLADRGAAVLYADHDVESVRRTADRLFSIEQGVTRLVEGFRDRPLREWYHEWPS
ncbi:MAG TPA: ATP-binding cassette domain-containing protein [Gemmatimonadales bacterium]|jgi:ABC-type multidrug transport system ATPase subunit|nr:ATP-binding cassette domain-containing protein [Gemmatimonadales bacterium]